MQLNDLIRGKTEIKSLVHATANLAISATVPTGTGTATVATIATLAVASAPGEKREEIESAQMNATKIRFQRVSATLRGNLGVRYAVSLDIESGPEVVILTVGIRDRAVVELEVMRANYDPSTNI